jgi:RHS repeat-associated protein
MVHVSAVVVNPRFTTPVPVSEPANTQFVGVRSATSGHRYYSPALGRFVNRDPIEEQGGLNLYAYCGNNGVSGWDYLGQDPIYVNGAASDYSRAADGTVYYDYGRVMNNRMQDPFSSRYGQAGYMDSGNGMVNTYGALVVDAAIDAARTSQINDLVSQINNSGAGIHVDVSDAGGVSIQTSPGVSMAVNSSGQFTVNRQFNSGTIIAQNNTATEYTGFSFHRDGAVGATVNALQTAGGALVNTTTATVNALATAGRAVVNNSGAIADQMGLLYLSNGIAPKVQFDAALFPGVAGSQSLTINTNGNRVYSVDTALLGGFILAGGEVFPIYGSPNAKSDWSLGGSGGYLGILGIDVKFNGLEPVYVQGFVGVGFGGSGKLEPPSVQTNLLEGTVDRQGNTNLQWLGGNK